MPLITAHAGRLQSLIAGLTNRTFSTGLPAIDGLLPEGGLSCGAIHEILTRPDHGRPFFFALLLARAAAHLGSTSLSDQDRLPGFIVWCDPQRQLHPPVLAAAGVPLDRLFLLHPKNQVDEVWAITECLRCKGIGAVIAAPGRLSSIEARRLQLAAERGGGVGLLVRTLNSASTHYAAATRWVVSPAPGERTIQRWTIQLIHGHGGRLGQSAILEYSRETHHVRAFEKLADRSGQEKAEQVASTGRLRASA